MIYPDELGRDDDVNVNHTLTRGRPGGMDRPYTGRIGRTLFTEIAWPTAANPEGGHLAPSGYRITTPDRTARVGLRGAGPGTRCRADRLGR